MRLLNTTTLDLRDFIGESTPKYAILSHTWGEEEIIFQDLSTATGAQDDLLLMEKKSFKKLVGFCSLAKEQGYTWCWIDTCCIDKTSSAELSEAINSMFRWYAESQVCFVYLADVRGDHFFPEPVDEFERSRWHTRGWTLQELLAPKTVEFYDLDWNQIGTRFSLRYRISMITGIRAEILETKFEVEASKHKYCVAEKMSWAANRNTSRVEDLAYCLLGMFDVNMPLLYGESIRAFERLQFQILAETEDLTLFAWQGMKKWDALSTPLRLLAKSPAYFCEVSDHYTYRLLDAGSYNGVLDDLASACSIQSGSNITGREELVLGPPVKRLNTVELSVAILHQGKTKKFLVLCKSNRRRAGNFEPYQEYLCLRLWDPSVAPWFKYEPTPRLVNLQHQTQKISFERISIMLHSNYNLKNVALYWQDRNWLVPKRSSAIIVSLQGPGDTSKFLLLHDRGIPVSALLLRQGLTEAVILYGWYDMSSSRTLQIIQWTLITTWQELQEVINLVPSEGKKRNPGDFAQRRLSRQSYMYSAIKPVPESLPVPLDWYLAHRHAMSDTEFQAFTHRPRMFFSLDVAVKSTEGKSLQVDFLGSIQFSDYTRLGDWINESNPDPRDVLLGNPLWWRERKG